MRLNPFFPPPDEDDLLITQNPFPNYGYRNRNLIGLETNLELKEFEDRYELYVDVPGCKENEVKVHVKEQYLEIKAHRELIYPTSDNILWSEINYGRFYRKFKIPENVDKDLITAITVRGVLTITLRKKHFEELSLVREIEVDNLDRSEEHTSELQSR